jgi:hypothetical protein
MPRIEEHFASTAWRFSRKKTKHGWDLSVGQQPASKNLSRKRNDTFPALFIPFTSNHLFDFLRQSYFLAHQAVLESFHGRSLGPPPTL